MDPILEKLDSSIRKGALLEEVLEDILTDLTFSNVRRQKSGAQYGYDLIAHKTGNRNEVWKFECKNLSNLISINDIAPKLIWHLCDEFVDRFIIVSVTGPSEYLTQLFQKVKFHLPIEIWSGDYLLQQISKSPKALQRLGITGQIKPVSKKVDPIIYEQSLVVFDALCSEKLPFSYDYFHTEKGLVKAYTEEWIPLVVGFCNNSKIHSFKCTEINVVTLYYCKVEGRIFRQSKLKGIIKPEPLSFVPSTIPARGLPLLDANTILEVKANQDEFLKLELNKDKTEPGYYELIFEAKGKFKNRELTMYSPVFPLHVAALNADIARLYVVGKFYDGPVSTVLNLEQDKWQDIKDMKKQDMMYLGPTMSEVMKGTKDSTWKIRSIKGKKSSAPGQFYMDIELNTPSLVYCDLNIPIEEKIYSTEDSFATILGPNWKKILQGKIKFPPK